jgi:hypothetical protein
MSREKLLTALTCGNCGSDLEGGGSALVYVCRNCKRAVFMKAPDKPYALRFLKPVLDRKSPLLYAPFWRCTGKLKLRAEDPRRLKPYAKVKPLGPLYFPAFWNMRLAYFDNLTLRYAQMDAGTFVFDDAADSRLMDGIRDPLVIPEMARLTWLAYLDRYSDVTGVTADFEAQRPVYTAVPFFKDGDSFVDGLCGVRLPSGFFSEADGR